MASSLSTLEEDLSCPVCCELFREPVLLSCSHSFCRTCLEKSWEQKEVKECPVCRRSSKEHPLSNLALKNACESFLKGKSVRATAGSENLCPQHFERLQLFCLDEEQLVCVECVSQQHEMHRLCSIRKAASECKEELRAPLKALQERLDSMSNGKVICDKMSVHIKTQAQHTERQIKEEFEKIHKFLRDEEEARIAVLREEEEEKSQRMKEKIEVMSALSERIKDIEEKMGAEEVPFLQNYKETKERAQTTLPDPELGSGLLIDVAKHLGNLRYRVWEKMKDISPYTPAILDPNTANAYLTLSEDLTSVADSGTEQDLPDNPERFGKFSEVLGSEGFTSGRHCWDVEVGDNDDWKIGVARQSVERKEECNSIPEDGFWTMNMNEGKYTPDISAVKLSDTKLQRIRVQLDFEAGQVIFSNAVNNRHLLTRKHTFTERVYPYFYTMREHPLEILPMKVSVSVENHTM